MVNRKGTKGQTIQRSIEKEQKDIDHCIVCSFVPFLLTIVLFVLLFLFYWPLYCLSFCSFSIDRCIVCSFVPFLLSVVLFVLLFLFYCPLYCLSFCSFSIVHCIVCPFVPFLLTIVLFVLLFLFYWPLYCLSFCRFSFGHCIVYPSFDLLPLWALLLHKFNVVVISAIFCTKSTIFVYLFVSFPLYYIFHIFVLSLFLGCSCQMERTLPEASVVWLPGQKGKAQKEKQRSTKHTHKTKDRVIRTPLKTGVNSGVPEG
jgi:hypothetical protein